MIDSYLTYLRDVRRMSPNTVESYARDLAALGSFAAAREVDVDALERRDLEAFVRSLMSSGLSPRSVARAVACVRGYYRFVAVEQKREESPADDLRAPHGAQDATADSIDNWKLVTGNCGSNDRHGRGQPIPHLRLVGQSKVQNRKSTLRELQGGVRFANAKIGATGFGGACLGAA